MPPHQRGLFFIPARQSILTTTRIVAASDKSSIFEKKRKQPGVGAPDCWNRRQRLRFAGDVWGHRFARTNVTYGFDLFCELVHNLQVLMNFLKNSLLWTLPIYPRD